MSMTFTKLFSSITESTVWCEPHGTRLTWITMLAMADRLGRIFASTPGLANRARVSLEECEQALRTFLAPDPYSRTPDNEGRRIEPISGGWRLLNHAKYRDMRDEESRREQNREAKQRQRRREHPEAGVEVSESADNQHPSANSSAQAEAEAEAEADSNQEQDIAHHDALFAEFWTAYPKKKGRKRALQRWRAQKVDGIARAVIHDVVNRALNDAEWIAGFIPDPTTYLTEERWMDEVQRAKPRQVTQLPRAPHSVPAEEVLARARPKHPSSASTVHMAFKAIGELLPPSSARSATGD